MTKNPRPVTATKPTGRIALLIVVALVVVAGGLYLLNQGNDAASDPAATRTPAGPDTPGAAPPAEAMPAKATPEANAALQTLLGRWLREDGGYVIEISGIMPDGTLKAGYFNPNPIHVSRAAAVEQSGNIKVGIELNDVNYPGCLYTLVHDASLDQLRGQYFQAGSGQTYEVAFVRMPAE